MNIKVLNSLFFDEGSAIALIKKLAPVCLFVELFIGLNNVYYKKSY